MITALSKVKTALAKITGLGSNVSTFLATPSSANLASALTDETGSGLAVFATSPTTSGMTAKNIVSEVLTTGGGTTAYTLTPSVAIGSYVLGQQFTIKMNATNTDASTINVSGLGARSFTKSGATALSPGDLAIDSVYTITYDGTQFQVSGGASSSAVGAASFVVSETPGGSINSSNTSFTSAASMITATLQVYQNGVRLSGGGVDFTQGSGTAFTMVTAPTTGDILLIDYSVSSGTYSTGSTSFVYDETPSGTVNSSNVTFTIASTPVAGSLTLYRDGQRLIAGGADYTLSGTTITFVTAPTTGSTLKVDYQSAVSAAGNADTVDGIHANDLGGTDAQLVADYGGWKKAPGSWTYASASTITVTTGAASVYGKGDRIRWKQGGAYKYGVIVTVADTLLTIAVNTDYTVANSAITDIYYSHEANPLGYPPFFNCTQAYTGFSSNPTSLACRYSIINTTFTAMWNEGSAGTSNNAAKTIQFPVTSSASMCPTTYVISVIDNGVQLYGKILITASTGTFNLYPGAATTWTTSGSCKTANGGATVSYEF